MPWEAGYSILYVDYASFHITVEMEKHNLKHTQNKGFIQLCFYSTLVSHRLKEVTVSQPRFIWLPVPSFLLLSLYPATRLKVRFFLFYLAKLCFHLTVWRLDVMLTYMKPIISKFYSNFNIQLPIG